MPSRLLKTAVMTLSLSLSMLAGRPAQAVSCQPGDSICQQLQQKQQTQQDVQGQLSQIQQNITNVQQKSTAIIQVIQGLNTQIDQQKQVIAATQAKLDETNRQIRYTQADISRRQAEVEARQQLLNQRVRAMDKHDSLNYFELVVTSQSFTQLVDRISTMQDIVRSGQQLLDQVKAAKAQVQQQQAKLQQEHDQVTALLQQQQAQQAQLDADVAAQQAALASYQQLEAQYQQQVQALTAQNNNLLGQIQQLQQQFQAEAQSSGGGSGQFAWPQHGTLTQPFGCTDLVLEPAPPPGVHCITGHFHYGLDIAANFGNPIGAADAGVVGSVVTGCVAGTFSCGGGYGNQVLIVHGNGYTTLYAHLSQVDVSVGQAVKRGQTIGMEGSTGASTGPHLHFGISFDGGWVDPQAYLG